MTAASDAAMQRLEAALAERAEVHFELTLIVSGASPLSSRALENATDLCEQHMGGRYHLSVVDLSEAPTDVGGGQVLAAPTLVKTRPLPIRKFVGDLSRTDRVLAALGLPPAAVGDGAAP